MPVKREQYSVNIQMILAIIPIVDLWASYRIEKLRFWILLYIGLALLDLTIESAAGYEISLVLSFLIGIPIGVFLMRYFTIEWNKKIPEETKNDSSFQDKTPQDSES